MPTPPATTPRLPEARVVGYLVLGLIAAVVCAYATVVRADFVDFDDPSHVLQNPLVLGGLSWRGIAAAFTHFHASLWIPLTWLSLMLDVSLFGLNPGAMHAANLAWHTASTVLLFLTLRRMTGQLWASAFVAALFGLHPINVESVAWIAERKNVLSTFFCLLAISAYARFARDLKPSSYLAALACAALSLLAKPMAVTLPCALLLLDHWPLGRWSRISWRRLLVEKIPFLLLSAAACGMALRAPQERGALVTAETLSLASRLSNALVSYAAYLRQILWPSGLAVYYPHPIDPQPALAIAAALLLAALTTVAFWSVKKRPYLFVGWCWFLGVLVPVLGLVQVGSQARADRFTYLPQLGLFLAATWLIKDAWPHRPRLLGLLAGPILAACALLTARQLQWWMDSVALFERAVAVTENNACAFTNAGLAHAHRGEFGPAAAHFQASLRVQFAQPAIWSEFGSALSHLGREADALKAFRTGLDLDPADQTTRYDFAVALERTNQPAAAIPEWERILAATPNFPRARYHLALALAATGRPAEALAQLRQAAQLFPQDAEIAAALQQLETPAG